jgi:hypothetical protein
VIHWVYFTPLRKSWSAWNQTVWWLSLVALLTSVIGVWLGLLRTWGNHANGRHGLSPFKGWMRWHHVIGLFAGVVVLFWTFSGWLSMDHGRLFSRGEATAAQIAAVRGISLDVVVRGIPLKELRNAGGAAVIEFNAVAGRALLSLRGAGLPSRVYWPHTGRTSEQISTVLLGEAVAAAWPGVTAWTGLGTGSARLYELAESLPLSARGFITQGARPIVIYMDAMTGRILVVMDQSRRDYAWMYYALHTLRFPAVETSFILRTVLVLVLLVFGAIFSLTGVVLGVRRLRRAG